VLVLIAIPLAALATFFLLYASAFTTHTQSTGFLGWFASIVGNIPLIGGLTADQILKLDSWILNAFGKHFQAIESRGVNWLGAQAVLAKRTAGASLFFPSYLWASLSWLLSKAIPHRIKAQTKPIANQAARADANAQIALRNTSGLVKEKPATNTQVRVTRIERVAMPHAQEWSWIHEHWRGLEKAIADVGAPPLTLPRPLAKALPWPFGVTPKQLFRRFRRVEALLGVTGLAAVMAGVLRIPSAKCLSQGPIGKVARALCGLSSSALEDLLGLLVDALILTDICAVIEALNAGVSLISPLIEDFVSGVDAVLCKEWSPRPPDDHAVTLSLPPVTGLTLSLP
jgi:hypothetical protein